MAVYTDVDDEDLIAFLSHYDLGGLLSCKGIAEGVENSNFYLHVDAGSFILTLYEKRVAEADLPFFLGLMEHLAAAGVTCPLPVRNHAGTALGRLAGRPAAIVTFLDGYSIHHPDAAHCSALGEALARLHLAGSGFGLSRAEFALRGRLAQAIRAAGRPRRRDRTGFAAADRGGTRSARTGLAEGFAFRRHPRRSFSRQCAVSGRSPLGIDRLLFRLRRRLRL